MTVDARQETGRRALRSGIVLLNDITSILMQPNWLEAMALRLEAAVYAGEFWGTVVVATAIATWTWAVDALDVLLTWISVFALDRDADVGSYMIECVLATAHTYERGMNLSAKHYVYIEAALQNAVDNLGIRRLYADWHRTPPQDESLSELMDM